MRLRRTLRRTLRGRVLAVTAVTAVIVLALAGITAAAVLRPADPFSAERAAATAAEDSDGAISLDALDGAVRPRREESADEQPALTGPSPQSVEVIGVGTDRFSNGVTTNPEDVDGYDPAQARASTDAEVRAELADFRDSLDGIDPRDGPRAYIDDDGRAVLPEGAPKRVALVVAAANEIATKPYKWGGGHGAWKDSGYDCSGSVSFALAGARLLDSPLASGAFLDYGDPGPGRWISIYTHPGHMFMTVAGLRFDTSGQGTAGTRWQRGDRSTAGFTVRHPPGL